MFSFTIREALLRTKLDLHVEFPFLPNFQLPGKRKIFKFSKNVPGISRNFREITGNFRDSENPQKFFLKLRESRKTYGKSGKKYWHPDILRIGEILGKFSREFFSSLIILTFFDIFLIFNISRLIFSILLCCFDIPSLSFFNFFDRLRKKF